MKKGDFFITNNVSSKGFTGHAAIYTGKGNPKHRYIKVYRASKKYRGKAGSYAKSHFNGVPYSITTNPYLKALHTVRNLFGNRIIMVPDDYQFFRLLHLNLLLSHKVSINIFYQKQFGRIKEAKKLRC